ncbi:MAG: YidC/Oxa1 family membrane protein insertase [Candidatus Curtissbacteria bacterium]|nr:YidC/Oxa1 family membrane protein insertase [Candidatus Curtissbacteria bacterium]
MNPYDTFLFNPILNLLIAIYTFLHALSIPGALGLSIIILSAGIRLVLWPLTSVQLRSTQKMAALKPHLDRIKIDHGHDKVRHQQEVSKLYKEHGVNPLAGCLPLLVQMPFFIGLYNVLDKALQFNNANFIGSINSHLYSTSLYLTTKPDTSFLGISLSTRPNEWAHVGFIILAIPLITGLLQFVQSKMLTPQVSPTAIKKSGDKKASTEDTMSQVQSQMTYLMPVMIAFFSYGFAVGLSLYWNTFTIIGIIQQYIISGPGALNKYLPKRLQKI